MPNQYMNSSEIYFEKNHCNAKRCNSHFLREEMAKITSLLN